MWIVTLSCLTWVGLLLFWGQFWRADQRLRPEMVRRQHWPAVAVIIPARDEAATIEAVLGAHAASSYPGTTQIFLVDDSSTDDTGEIAMRFARSSARPVHVIQGAQLEAGWSGKLWALHQGIADAGEGMPEAAYFLLTDADIEHGADTLAKLVDKAEEEGLALTSLMARLDSSSGWGSLLMPAFVFFFQKLYPFALINKPDSRVAGAAGGCVLISREVLEDIGGVAAIKGALIDDCTLARKVKAGPPRRAIWLGLAGDEVISLRDNSSFASIWKMVSRTAFTQLRHSLAMLAVSTIGMALLYLAGPLAVLSYPLHQHGLLLGIGLLNWALICIAYWPTAVLYGQRSWWSATLPIAAVLYIAMTIDSAISHWCGKGGAWKGRTYPVSRK